MNLERRGGPAQPIFLSDLDELHQQVERDDAEAERQRQVELLEEAMPLLEALAERYSDQQARYTRGQATNYHEFFLDWVKVEMQLGDTRD